MQQAIGVIAFTSDEEGERILDKLESERAPAPVQQWGPSGRLYQTTQFGSVEEAIASVKGLLDEIDPNWAAHVSVGGAETTG
jgi:hypothetical protein